jgi:hypothetical protein
MMSIQEIPDVPVSGTSGEKLQEEAHDLIDAGASENLSLAVRVGRTENLMDRAWRLQIAEGRTMQRTRAGTPIWLWMVAVAALAVLLGAGMTKQRSKTYRARAAYHAASRQMYSQKAKQAGAGPGDRYQELAAYHDRLRQVYEHAASRPWFAVEPDPPPPEPQ